MLRPLLVGLLLAAAIVRPVQGQDTTHAPVASLPDSAARARSTGSAVESRPAAQRDSLTWGAESAGRLAAAEGEVGGHFVLSLLGGVCAGFFLPRDVRSDALVGSAGVAMVILSTQIVHRGAEPPPAVLEQLRDRTPEYQQEFRSAYASELKRRRVGASLLGGGIGAGIGYGTLLFVAIMTISDF